MFSLNILIVSIKNFYGFINLYALLKRPIAPVLTPEIEAYLEKLNFETKLQEVITCQ